MVFLISSFYIRQQCYFSNQLAAIAQLGMTVAVGGSGLDTDCNSAVQFWFLVAFEEEG